MPAPTALQPTRTHPFVHRNIPWFLKSRAEAFDDRVFLAWEPFAGEPATYTYTELADNTQKVAKGLYHLGVRQGDYVILHMNNCPEFIFTWFALSELGAVAVTTNTRSSMDEMHYFIEHCDAKCAITQPAFCDLITEAASDLTWIVSTETDSGEPADMPDNIISFATLYQSDASLPEIEIDALDPNSVQYTSGTTSRPKGVVWTHANALFGAKTMAQVPELKTSDVTHVIMPLYHTNALIYSMMATMYCGGKIVLQPRFSASRYWNVIEKHQINWGSIVPFVMHALRSQPVPESHSIEFWGLGAAEAPTAKRIFGIRTTGWYGMTETVGAVLMTENHHENLIGSIGVAAAGYEVKVVNDKNEEVAVGEDGVIKVRGIPGISLFYEYLNNPEATAESFDAEGWFDTGDIVTPLEDGSFAYVQRIKDMLKVGAENVAAAEIERVVAMAGNVREAAVVGKPDKMLDEVPVVFVIARKEDPDLPDRILETCRDQLADFKVPREVFVVDSLPRVTLEKIDKKTLRAQLKS